MNVDLMTNSENQTPQCNEPLENLPKEELLKYVRKILDAGKKTKAVKDETLQENRRLQAELLEIQYRNDELETENLFLKRERKEILLDEENLLLPHKHGKSDLNDDSLIIRSSTSDFTTPRGCLWRLGSFFQRK